MGIAFPNLACDERQVKEFSNKKNAHRFIA